MSARNETFDVAVIGAGPAGMAAAVRAAESKARVVVIDEGLAPGGQIWRPSTSFMRPRRAEHWVGRLDASSAEVRRSSSVVDVKRGRNEFFVRMECAGTASDVVAKRVVLATGARELFLPFPGWTLPNVVGIGGAQALVKAGADLRGRRVVIAGSGPLLLPVAASLTKAGATIALVAEQAPRSRVMRFGVGLFRKPSMLVQAASLRLAFARAPYAMGTWVVSATGDQGVTEVLVTDGVRSRAIACDLLCTAYGLVPNVELARLLGCEVDRGMVIVDEFQRTSVPGVFAAGEPTGVGGVEMALIEGEIAGADATGGFIASRLLRTRGALARDAGVLRDTFRVRDEVRALAKPDTIVCRCEDVRLGALDRGWPARQAKLYTRVGMGPCQGRICGAALECVLGWPPDSVRPPAQPARVSTLLLDPPTISPTTKEAVFSRSSG